ncbi:Os01g0828500 [Oryza sativa Japonica Group]|uniref:Os01g0828500 protein n=1 Tax=Oryza sativa subsp. japonica TaxID=39947 RepID=A0A0P0V9W3_ORYSJ|nr:Os01g0828500 [Oryza sativa Japonica Group]
MIEKSIEHMMVMPVRSKRGLMFYSHHLLNYIASPSLSNLFHCWASPMPSDTDQFASHCEYLRTQHRRLKCHVGLPDTTRMASVGVWVTVNGHFKLPVTKHFLENVLFKLSYGSLTGGAKAKHDMIYGCALGMGRQIGCAACVELIGFRRVGCLIVDVEAVNLVWK